MFYREHFSGATESTLNFITDHHDAVFVTNRPNCAQELRRRLVETAFALDRFDDDRCNVFCFNIDFENCIQARKGIFNRYPVVWYRERRMKYAGYWYATTRLVRNNFPGQGAGQRGAAVKSTFERNHAGPAGSNPRDFDGVFNCFRASREKDRLGVIHRRQFVQSLCQGNVGLVGANLESRVREQVALLFRRRHDLWMAVAGIANRNSDREIDVALAIRIPQFGV